jgi:hypothetical protein
MNSLSKKLEAVANIAIIVVALVVAGVLITRAVRPAGADNPAASKSISAGDKISLAKMDWQANGNTLLVAVAKGCHFCSESAPFYQRIMREVSGRSNLKVVAVFPDDESEGRRYLADLGLAMPEVRRSPLEQIGVAGTPTLILVNHAGIATAVWVGKLPPEKESEVLEKLKA